MNDSPATDAEPDLRFRFGENWRRFLAVLDEDRVREARESLAEMLGLQDMRGLRFLDAGCGSGLFSLAARQLGAEVHSFDYDSQSVACTRTLRERFFPGDEQWRIEEGSVLDAGYLERIGQYDIVYSWGVLHHTGDMAKALANVLLPLKDGGLLYIALYNDQDLLSRFWKRVKRLYCSGTAGRWLVTASFVPVFATAGVLQGLFACGNPMAWFSRYRRERGMSPYHDWIDWLGGYPFEVAKPGDIVHRYREAGLTLIELRTTNGLGCNQFVFFKGKSGDTRQSR